MLPIEVCEKIIGESKDRPCLATCSLVCKAWIPKSRQLLLRNHPLHLDSRNAEKFTSLLKNPNCTLGPFITTVHLDAYLTFPLDSTAPSRIDDLAQSLIDKCINLMSLGAYGLSTTILSRFTNLSSSLTHLQLSGSWLIYDYSETSLEVGTLLDFIGNFRVLEALAMHYSIPKTRMGLDPITPTYDPKITKLPPSHAHLRRIELGVIWNVFLPWFLLPGVLDFPGLETMELKLARSPFPVGKSLLQSFLNVYSSSVKNLILHLMWWSLPDAKVDLSHFTFLRSILFRIQGPPDELEDEDGLQLLADIVSTCPKRSPKDPLPVILTNDDEGVEPVAVEGVRWILDRRYEYEEYVRSDSEVGDAYEGEDG